MTESNPTPFVENAQQNRGKRLCDCQNSKKYRNLKKSVDNSGNIWYTINPPPLRRGSGRNGVEKTFLRNLKKVLDKVRWFGYNRKAAIEQRRTLKIEQQRRKCTKTKHD